MYFNSSHGKYMVWMFLAITHLISLIRISFRYVAYVQSMASGSRKRKRIEFALGKFLDSYFTVGVGTATDLYQYIVWGYGVVKAKFVNPPMK